ncbi:MAG: hypothetical protein AAGF66_05760 [Cyanobacteria bacterium P01_H01_bin.119]
MNRYILGVVLALLAYVGVTSGADFIDQVANTVSSPSQSNGSNGADDLTPVQRVGLGASRESDTVPPTAVDPNFGSPDTAPAEVSPTVPSADVNATGQLGDFPPQTSPLAPTADQTLPVDNSIPALW